jgi:hypothetical protein
MAKIKVTKRMREPSEGDKIISGVSGTVVEVSALKRGLEVSYTATRRGEDVPSWSQVVSWSCYQSMLETTFKNGDVSFVPAKRGGR